MQHSGVVVENCHNSSRRIIHPNRVGRLDNAYLARAVHVLSPEICKPSRRVSRQVVINAETLPAREARHEKV